MMMVQRSETVLVVDFGAQYAQLIARRVRELNVYSEIVPHRITAAELAADPPAALILSGGPKSVHVEGAPSLDPAIYELGIPILGICYGHQLIAQQLGGEVGRGMRGEYGRAKLEVADGPSALLHDLPSTHDVWMSHFDAVTRAPEGFVVTASTADSLVAGMESDSRRIWGVQFHPEVVHSPHGMVVLQRFLHDLAGCEPSWTMDSIIDSQVAAVRAQVGDARAICGLSGGVDSAVAALLLKRAGHEVIGLFMKNWEDDDDDEYCSTREDLVDAVSVADVIGIDIEQVNFAREYKERVFAHFLDEYRAGRTPNPDVLCNNEIKFAAFLDHALKSGADRIATGHYAGVREVDGLFQLLKGEDGTKDQSYFLHRLNQHQLSKAMFPLAALTKREVRAIAEREKIPTYNKKDSTGICFVGERPFREFLERYLPRTAGAMRTPEGLNVGEHQGIAYYTIGQRAGLGIGGQAGGDGEPWFVAAKDPAKNELIVVQGHDHRLLLNDAVEIGNIHWIAGTAAHTHWVYAAKTRYRQEDAACSLGWLRDGRGLIEFAKPQWAVTPGQYAVVYESKVCLGGGVIA